MGWAIVATMRCVPLLVSFLLAGCSTVDRGYPDYRGNRGYGHGTRQEIGVPQGGYDRGREYGPNYAYEMAPPVLDIPHGQLPPPGLSRIWFPHRPPGQQPPPADYRYLVNRVPPGAWLINVPARDPNHVHVSVFDSGRVGRIVDTGIYFRNRGRLVREDVRRR